MKSSIKVDFADLGSGIEPIIRVKAVTTDDPRDSLIKTLFQGLDNYLQVEFVDEKHGVNDAGLPVMDKTIILYRPKGRLDKRNIYGNSIALREFLTSEKIEWQPNEHFTIIPANVDAFELGQKFERFKNEYVEKH